MFLITHLKTLVYHTNLILTAHLEVSQITKYMHKTLNFTAKPVFSILLAVIILADLNYNNN